MDPTILASLVLAVLLGVLLIVLGVKGRRINDHPVCRQCHFDLDGVYPEMPTCPECGSGLKREKSVLIGARKKRPLAIVVGVVLAFAPLAPIGAVAVALLTGKDVNAYKPLALLLWEARRADAARAPAIANELLTRARTNGPGKLDASQYAKAIDTVLAIQNDPTATWIEGWGDLIEQAKLDGVLSAKAEETFIAQAPTLKITTRPTTRAGNGNAGPTIPVRIDLAGARVASGTSLNLPLTLESASVDGKAATLNPASTRTRGDPTVRILGWNTTTNAQGAGMPLGMIPLQGSRAGQTARMIFTSPFGGSNQLDQIVNLTLPPGLAPGKHTLTLKLNLATQDPYASGNPITIINGRLTSPTAAPTTTVPITLTTKIEVLPDNVPTVQPIAQNPETDAKLQDAFAKARLTHDLSGRLSFASRSEPWLLAIPRKDAIPLPIAADIILIEGTGAEQKETVLGSYTTGTRAEDPDQDPFGMGGFGSFSYTVSINGQVTSTSSADTSLIPVPLDHVPADDARIVLRPSEKVAEQTLDLTEYYNAEIPLVNAINPAELARARERGEDPFERALKMQADMERRMNELMQRRRPSARPRVIPSTPTPTTPSPTPTPTPSSPDTPESYPQPTSSPKEPI
ncbi:MAG: hypothetical protein IPK69_06940 [Phycisphaerales bacterium]|nr:MAG: hypothetical protein IPK69_06940 [Phycisphaerales bacterium]